MMKSLSSLKSARKLSRSEMSKGDEAEKRKKQDLDLALYFT